MHCYHYYMIFGNVHVGEISIVITIALLQRRLHLGRPRNPRRADVRVRRKRSPGRVEDVVDPCQQLDR